jgi:hypothetical protein
VELSGPHQNEKTGMILKDFRKTKIALRIVFSCNFKVNVKKGLTYFFTLPVPILSACTKRSANVMFTTYKVNTEGI